MLGIFRKAKWKSHLKMAYQNRMAMAYVAGWAERKNLPEKNHIPIWQLMLGEHELKLRDGPLTGYQAINLRTQNQKLRSMCAEGGPVRLIRSFDEEFSPRIGWSAWLKGRLDQNSN